MGYELGGTYLESCNCDAVCPCTASGLTAPGDNERCQVTLAFHIDAGQVEGLDVADRSVVLFADAPHVMADGGWEVALYIDDAADEAQMEALLKVFSGQAGGPMAALAPLIGEVLGVERAPIRYSDQGRRHDVRVGELIDIEVEDQVAPQYGEAGPVMKLTDVFHPANSTCAGTGSPITVGCTGSGAHPLRGADARPAWPRELRACGLLDPDAVGFAQALDNLNARLGARRKAGAKAPPRLGPRARQRPTR